MFGCVAYALVPVAKRRKFGDRTEKMRFLGYHKGHRGYRLMERGGNRVFYRTDVTFDEHNFRLTPEEDERRVMETPSVEIDVCSSGRRAGKPAPEVPVAVPDRVPANLRVMPEMVAIPNEPQPELAAVHSRPTRMKKPIDRYGVDEQAKVIEVDEEVEELIASALCAAEMDEPKTLREARKRPDASKWLAAAQEEMNSLMEHETWSLTKLPPGRKIVGSKWVFKVKLDENGEAARYKCRLVAEMDEPKTLREARKRPDASKWLAAAQEEMNSLMEHETWSLTKLPPGRKIVGSKWVFKVKLDENGEAARYKCRLVAQGYTQAQGVDYHETFAPVARFGSIRTLLATAAQRRMHVHQMDVHTAFLTGKLDEDIYMSQPEGFVVEGKEEQVCHLHRSLYGLKQSPRCWNRELNCHLIDSGFKQSKADPCVYYRWKNGNLNIVSIYVDDLILVVDLMKDLEQTKEELSARFKMKDLGQLRYCLGIVCEQRTGCIKLNQRPYIDNLVRRFGLDKACGVSTPADACVKLVAEDGISQPADPRLFQQIVGSLQYAAGGTRPDIAYAVSSVAKFCNQPTELHLTAAKSVLRYLKQTRDLSLTYVKNTPEAIIGYSDADWAGDVKDRRSTSGNVFLLGGAAITWASKKQSSVALSTVEAEYMSLSVATHEAIWLRQLQEELGMKDAGPTLIYEDNQGAISMAKNPVFHKRTKHIQIRYHFVREAVEDEVITLEYCRTSEMLADSFTKPLPHEQFERLRIGIGLS